MIFRRKAYIADRSDYIIALSRLSKLPWCLRQSHWQPCGHSHRERHVIPASPHTRDNSSVTGDVRAMRGGGRGGTAVREYAVINSRIGAHDSAPAESRSLTSLWRQSARGLHISLTVNTHTHTHTQTTYALLVFYTFSHYYTCNAFTRGISPPDWRERIVLTVRLSPSRAQNKTKHIFLDLVFDSFMVLYVLFYIIIKYKPERNA